MGESTLLGERHAEMSLQHLVGLGRVLLIPSRTGSARAPPDEGRERGGALSLCASLVLGNSTQLNNARMNQKVDTHSQERGGGFLFFWVFLGFLGISNFKPKKT